MVTNSSTLQQKIFKTLRDRIVFGVYEPGRGLPEKEIFRELNDSRTPFRKAVLKLQDMKLVTVIPRCGTNVSPVDINDVKAAFELRVELEGVSGQRPPKE